MPAPADFKPTAASATSPLYSLSQSAPSLVRLLVRLPLLQLQLTLAHVQHARVYLQLLQPVNSC
jgi:hypothetical protein